MVEPHELADGEYRRVDNSAMTYMLINAFKEQKEIIDALKAQVKDSSQQNANYAGLEDRLKALDSEN